MLYALIVLEHDRRRLLSFGVTSHPTAAWIARQITEAFPWDQAPRHLIRDRDAAYGRVVRQRLRAMAIRDRPVAFSCCESVPRPAPPDRAQSQPTCSRLQRMIRRTTSMFIISAITDRVSRGWLKTAPIKMMNTLTSRPNLK